MHEAYIKKGFFMKLNWHDSLDIAIALAEKHPDVDVQYIRFTDLHRYVCELDDFVGEPDKSSEAILEAIQMAWLDELDWLGLKVQLKKLNFTTETVALFHFVECMLLKRAVLGLAVPTRDSLPLYQQTKLRADKNWLECFFRSL